MEINFDPENHTYTTTDGTIVPSVTQVLKECRIIDTSRYTEFSRVRGTYVHKALEYLDKGILDEDSLDPELIPYVAAYKRFLSESGFITKEIEKVVYSDTYRFAGTLDRIGIFPKDNTPCVLDIKTGNPEPWHSLQLAGYSICFSEPYKRYGLYLSDNESYKLVQFKDRKDTQVFLACVTIYHWRLANGNHTNIYGNNLNAC